AWRTGVRMQGQTVTDPVTGADVRLDPPRLVQRPDPFRTPRDFWRSVGWNLATPGEADLYVGARDSDGMPPTLLNGPPAERVGRFEHPRDAVVNAIAWEWRGAPIPASSIVQIVFAQEPGSPRGLGPLQLCGAAISVARESLEWAANYYSSGGLPSV